MFGFLTSSFSSIGNAVAAIAFPVATPLTIGESTLYPGHPQAVLYGMVDLGDDGFFDDDF